MPSKWAFLRSRYPALPIDPTYGDAIEVQVAEYKKKAIADLAYECNQLEARLNEHETVVRELKAAIEAIERALGDKLEDAGLDSIVTAGYRWSPSYEPYPHVVDRPALRAWAEAHMADNLALPWQTLRTVVKDALNPDAEATELPPGVQVYVKRSFRRTKQ